MLPAKGADSLVYEIPLYDNETIDEHDRLF